MSSFQGESSEGRKLAARKLIQATSFHLTPKDPERLRSITATVNELSLGGTDGTLLNSMNYFYQLK